MVAAESGRVGKQLAAASTEGQVGAGVTIARRRKRAPSAQLPSARQTRSATSRAGATLAIVEAAKEAVEAEEAAEDQALQDSGLEGRSILLERGAEVQEGGRVLLDALRNRDPGLLEKVRTRLGRWVTAGDEDESNLDTNVGADGTEWEGWGEVLGGGPRSAQWRPPCGWCGRTGTWSGARWRWHWWSSTRENCEKAWSVA